MLDGSVAYPLTAVYEVMSWSPQVKIHVGLIFGSFVQIIVADSQNFNPKPVL